MISQRPAKLTLFVVIAGALSFSLMRPTQSLAQTAQGDQSNAAAGNAGTSMAQSAQQAATALSGDQQSAANSALCSAVGSQVSNPATATPSMLSSPTVISAAAASFAGSTKLPLPSATSMLQAYVAQHATDILASCAVSNATGGLTSKIPSSLPSIPSMPSMP
jgi:hypothetical protein